MAVWPFRRRRQFDAADVTFPSATLSHILVDEVRPIESRYVVDPQAVGVTDVEHLDGVSWSDAPLPPVNHECWAQTRGWYKMFERIYRCACGAVGGPGEPWIRKNERQRAR
jgi:hypothetical protein